MAFWHEICRNPTLLWLCFERYHYFFCLYVLCTGVGRFDIFALVQKINSKFVILTMNSTNLSLCTQIRILQNLSQYDKLRVNFLDQGNNIKPSYTCPEYIETKKIMVSLKTQPQQRWVSTNFVSKWQNEGILFFSHLLSDH